MTDKNRCCILLCGQSVFVHGRLASNEQMQAALKLAGQKCTSDTVPVPVPLCKHHYHLVYNLLQPAQTKCITWYIPKACNPWPKVMSKTREVPQKTKLGLKAT